MHRMRTQRPGLPSPRRRPITSPAAGARRKDDGGAWIPGEAIIRIKDDRNFIIYRDAHSRHFFELRTQRILKQAGERLIGRYANLADEKDTGPWVGLIIGNERIDGKSKDGR
jgi:hypothetical protein